MLGARMLLLILYIKHHSIFLAKSFLNANHLVWYFLLPSSVSSFPVQSLLKIPKFCFVLNPGIITKLFFFLFVIYFFKFWCWNVAVRIYLFLPQSCELQKQHMKEALKAYWEIKKSHFENLALIMRCRRQF